MTNYKVPIIPIEGATIEIVKPNHHIYHFSNGYKVSATNNEGGRYLDLALLKEGLPGWDTPNDNNVIKGISGRSELEEFLKDMQAR
ncbi:hypothetical protein JavanS250_0019 [Streptococcus satellite phage Javan250]|uniref:hypothetical protein n=1 Tax=Streptococcus halotolerans TaxID=1814128 RepID=UPI000787016F|nr:hypothetical protein [Streptococcus halotolerans]QBX08352.1 hypothetical protein JavanS250_0019 [Streptococcus satellite phage Javan250]